MNEIANKLTPATVTKTIIGRSVDFIDGTPNPSFPIEINGTSEDISVTTSDGNTFPDATTGNVTEGFYKEIA